MKIAILDEDDKVVIKIRDKIGSHFDLSFFMSEKEFFSQINNFDVVLIGKKFIDESLIEKISEKDIEIGLLNKGNIDFDNEHIAIFLDEEDINQIKEKLSYFETKIRIKNLVNIEQKTLNDMKRIALKADFIKEKSKQTEEFLKKLVKSTYYLEMNDDIAILEIRDVLRTVDKEEISEQLENVGFKVAVYFSMNMIASVHLGVLANLWKEVKKNNGKIVYWNKLKNARIISVLKLCNMNNILEIVDSYEDVKNKLTGD